MNLRVANSNQDPYTNHLYQHSKSERTDHLYDPLRKTAINPQQIDKHQIETQHAIQKSRVSHNYKHLSYQQYDHIKNQTYIPNEQLKATHNIQKVEGKNYFIMDAQEKTGPPISQEQFRRRSQYNKAEEVIVYEPQQKLFPQPQKIQNLQKPQDVKVKSKPSTRKESKYNLYSMLDQPLQRVKKSGCGAFTCPTNQCIASDDKYPWS